MPKYCQQTLTCNAIPNSGSSVTSHGCNVRSIRTKLQATFYKADMADEVLPRSPRSNIHDTNRLQFINSEPPAIRAEVD